MSKLKLMIKILLGREMYIPQQVRRRVQVFGGEGGNFPVSQDSIPNPNASLVVYSFGVGEDLSFSVELLKAYPNAHIYAFDPTPKAIHYAEHHELAKDNRFSFAACGISDSDGIETFYLPKNQNFVSGSVVAYDGVNDKAPLEVQMRTLQTCMYERGHQKIDILKMDIEGSEFKVIPQILSSGVQFSQLCIEVHQRFIKDGKARLRQMIALLNEHGYSVAKVLDSGEEILFVQK